MCKYLAADKPPGYSKFMKDHNTCIIASLFIFSETYLLSKCHHCLISSFFTGPFWLVILYFWLVSDIPANDWPPDCKHINIVSSETAAILTFVLLRRRHCFVLKMSGYWLLSRVKNNINILVFLFGSQADLLNHLHFLATAGTIQFSVFWSFAGACREKGILGTGKAGRWLPCPARYLPN